MLELPWNKRTQERLNVRAAARILDAELVEEPPYAPYLLKDGRRTALCIAHTGTSIALGIASVKDPVMGLDLETMRPVRVVTLAAPPSGVFACR